MNITDIIIGFTLVNALPHIEVWQRKGRMLSGLGIGPVHNLGYGLLNLTVSIGLFVVTYGPQGFGSHGMYVGGLFIVAAYIVSGRFFYERYNPRQVA
ncbi:MAG: hypothetical protein AAF721_14385 [Myxococcota bacterium]